MPAAASLPPPSLLPGLTPQRRVHGMKCLHSCGASPSPAAAPVGESSRGSMGVEHQRFVVVACVNERKQSAARGTWSKNWAFRGSDWLATLVTMSATRHDGTKGRQKKVIGWVERGRKMSTQLWRGLPRRRVSMPSICRVQMDSAPLMRPL